MQPYRTLIPSTVVPAAAAAAIAITPARGAGFDTSLRLEPGDDANAPRVVEEPPALRPVQFNLALENDSAIMGTFIDPSDDHYTHGTSIALAFDGTLALDVAKWIPFYDSFAEGAAEPPRAALGITLAQMIFTPDEDFRYIAAPIPFDRPYNGYLFLGVYSQRATERTLDHLQLDFGAIGRRSYAQHVQDFYHKLIGDDRFVGWPNQHKSEFTFQATLRKKWRSRLLERDSGSALELIPQIGGTLGTINRSLEAGLMARWGWNLPDDFGPHRLVDVQSATGRYHDESGVYFFGQAIGRAVEHNELLEGRSFKVDEKPLVGELRFGIVGYFNPSPSFQLELGWALTLQSEEFEGQDDIDTWGAYFLRGSWGF